MCQLLGISSAAPVRVSFNWGRFAMRGSEAAGNPDGWGVAYSEGTDVRVLREPSPAADSDLVAFLASHGPPTTTVLSHVRRATLGGRELANTQPFAHGLSGRTHVFAHNGHVSSLEAPTSSWLQPIGTTDSEIMFSILLGRLEVVWRSGNTPSLAVRSEIVATFAEEMRSLGASNFLYFDGLTLFAHSHRRTIPGAAISQESGLHVLLRDGMSKPNGYAPCDGLGSIGACEKQALVATIPLDDQPWRPLLEGELIRLENGAVV